MIRDVDFDQSGEIEFSEFLHMLAKFKKGDSKFGAFGKLVARMNATPLAALNGEARKRHLLLSYKLREVREATPVTKNQHCSVLAAHCAPCRSGIERVPQSDYGGPAGWMLISCCAAHFLPFAGRCT